MENLIALVESLRPGEIQLIQHLYSFKNNPENKKRDRLLRLIVEKEAKDDETALFILYGDKSHSAFSQLKTRLREDIMNVLLLQDPSVKFTARYAQASFDCRRSIIQGEMLLARGVYQEAISVLSRAAKLAKKYELFAEQVIIEDILRNHVTAKSGTKPFAELSESIESAIEKLDKLQRIKHDHYMMTRPDLCRAAGMEFAAGAKKIMEKLEEEISNEPSARMLFYYHIAALNYHSYFHNYELALTHGTALLSLVETDQVLQSRANLAGVNLEIAGIMLHLSRNSEALKHAQASMECFKPGMLNELNSMYKMFFAYFRENEMEKAEALLQQALKHRQLKYNDLLNAQWMLIKAAMEFKKGEFQASVKTLKKDNTLTRDKSGWLIGYHLMDIMNMLEVADNNVWIDNKIESLKKVMYRQSDRVEEDNPRFTAIIKLLQSLVSSGYNYTETIEEEKELLKQLAEGRGRYHWNPAGPEVIRFDQWMLAKVKPAKKAS
jgi:tetratricopeptide (TPR) repeat protein